MERKNFYPTIIVLLLIFLLIVQVTQLIMLREWFQNDTTELVARASAPEITATVPRQPTRTTMPTVVPSPTPPLPTSSVRVSIDVGAPLHTISPYIYGISNSSAEIVHDLRPTMISWGGNPSSRYNWRLGNAWNTGRDWAFRNVDYGFPNGSVSNQFLAISLETGAAARLAVPLVGWVASDTDNRTCSFRDANGDCHVPENVDCNNNFVTTDPALTSVISTPDDIIAWLQHIRDQNLPVRFIAMGNEPELWGYTHYDVHPDCTTYAEIRDKYIAYAEAVRTVMPKAELTGPVTCCWHFYWHSAAGTEDKLAHGSQDFLPWFLDQMADYEAETGTRLLDVLDLHYYPEGVTHTDDTSPYAEHRLRSTRSLWDPTYVDESWIGEAIYLIPRMKALIADHYPETKFGISEWNFGADETMNGALAIADVLGIFGKHDVYFASYWQNPPIGSAGSEAFKLYTNYDGRGGRFGDVALSAESDTPSLITYSAYNTQTDALHIMLINQSSDETPHIAFDLTDFQPANAFASYTFAGEATVRSLHATENGSVSVVMPPYAISHLVIPTND